MRWQKLLQTHQQSQEIQMDYIYQLSVRGCQNKKIKSMFVQFTNNTQCFRKMKEKSLRKIHGWENLTTINVVWFH